MILDIEDLLDLKDFTVIRMVLSSFVKMKTEYGQGNEPLCEAAKTTLEKIEKLEKYSREEND